MNYTFKIESIGKFKAEEESFSVQLNKKYIEGLKHLEGYSHIHVLWWAHLYDDPDYRSNLVSNKLFKKGPDKMGVFSTRSPVRPNPIMLSIIAVKEIDYKNGIIYTPFIDAEPETPVLDIKPYNRMERVRDCKVPAWFNHWPEWYEEASSFNWEEEINK